MKHAVFFLKNNIFRRHAIEVYKSISSNEKLSFEELAKLNFSKRQDIVTYAYNRSKFYKTFYDSKGFHPNDLKVESDWDKVPVLSRKDIIENEKDIIVKGCEKFLLPISTGGSTGVPLRVYHDKRFPSEVLGWRMLGWWGLSPAEHFANVYRAKKRGFLNTIFNRLIWFPTRRINLDASSMSREDMEDFIRSFNKLKPGILQGYVGAIEQLALFVLENNIRIEPPMICWTTSSPITSVQRHTIKRAFNCDVLDQYGSCEIFWLAQECPHHNGLHINYDSRHISILDGDGEVLEPGRVGDIAITDLDNMAFPVIKYKNGDKGAYKKNLCSCGLPFPLLAPVTGRVTDCIYLPDRSIIGGDYLTTIFDPFPDAVLGFQVYQKKDGSLMVYYIPNQKAAQNMISIIQKIQSTLSVKTRNLINIKFEPVEVISHDRGKNRYVISELNPTKR